MALVTQQKADQTLPKQWRMTPGVYTDIREAIGSKKAEQGGILGGSRERGEVTHFYFDEQAKRTGGSYSPDHQHLTQVLKHTWKPQGIDFLGFVHSHPAYFRRLSGDDVEYAERILEAMELPYLLLPIVMAVPDAGAFELLPFVAARQGEGIDILTCELAVAEVMHPAQKPQPVVPSRRHAEVTLADLGLMMALLGLGIATRRVIRRWYCHSNRH